MDDLFAQACGIDQFQGDVIILPARQARPQRPHLDRKRKPHLDARIKRPKVALVIFQRVFDHLKAKIAFGMGIERPHDAAHVDALLFRLKAHSARDRRFQHHLARIAGAVADGQAKVRNAHMLDHLLGAHDQAGRAILQVGQAVFINFVHQKRIRIGAVQHRIASAQQSPHRRVKRHDISGRGAVCPAFQHSQGCLGLVAAGLSVEFGVIDIHGSASLCDEVACAGYRAKCPVPQPLPS